MHKKLSEMPWDDPDFVNAMRRAFWAGSFSGRRYEYTTENDFEEFMIDVEKGYED